MDEIMKKRNYILDTPIKKVWNLNELHVGETLTGIPTASYFKNRNSNEFVVIDLDYGYAVCKIFFLIFSFPEQKIVSSNFHNSFQLVKFYHECNGEGIDEGINQIHNVNWAEIIEFLNEKETIKIKCISKNINGFKNIVFLE